MSLLAPVSSLRTCLLRNPQNSTIPTLVRGKKKEAPVVKRATPTQRGPPPDMPGDNSTEIVRKELYPPSQPSRSPNPWCPPRPDRLEKLAKAIPSPEAHSTIERSLQIHAQLAESERKQALKFKLQSMFDATEELRVVYKPLYDLAVKDRPEGVFALVEPVAQGRGKVARLFPREMMLPTDTPGKEGWDYDWKYVPEVERVSKVLYNKVTGAPMS